MYTRNGRKNDFLSLCITLLVCTAFCALPSIAEAEAYAEIGFIYPDGTVQIDESRFTPLISTLPGQGVPHEHTILSISNGLLKLLRMGDDHCTTEEMQIFRLDFTKGTFDPLSTQHGSGWYPNSSDLFVSDLSGPIFVRDLQDAKYLTDCVDSGCASPREAKACRQLSPPNNPPCGCASSTEPATPWDLGGLELEGGCEHREIWRSWWTLLDSVQSQYVQQP